MDITRSVSNNKDCITFPVVDTYSHVFLPYTGTIYLDQNATNNCQLFSIASANAMIGYSQEDTKQLLNFIRDKVTLKRMMLIDINKQYLKMFKEQYGPFMKYIKVSHYKSSNSSNMCVVVSQIDPEKLK